MAHYLFNRKQLTEIYETSEPRRTLTDPLKVEKPSSKSPVEKTSTKVLKIFKNLEKLCLNFEDKKKLENQKVSPKNMKKTKTMPKSSQEDKTKIKFIIAQLKHRIKSYPKQTSVCISSNRLKITKETENKVGPGSYKPKKFENIESHKFSSLPRFLTPSAQWMKNFQLSRSKNNSFIRKNKINAIYPEFLNNPSEKFEDGIQEENLQGTRMQSFQKKKIIDLNI